MEKRDVIIVDIDGTLVDSSIPYQYLNGKVEDSNYETYFRTLDRVKEIKGVKELIYRYVDLGCDIIFLTGRSLNKFSCYYTLEYIENNFNDYLKEHNKGYQIFFRAFGDKSQNKDLKIDKINYYLYNYNVKAIFEDELEVLNSYKEIFDINKVDIYLIDYIPTLREGISDINLSTKNLFSDIDYIKKLV